MIDVYSWTTGNARKVYIMLEETGLDYRVHPVDITKDDQFKPDFLAISPNNKIPAIIDRDGPGGTPYALCESGAILMYLADKTGRFLPADPMGRSLVIQWLMFQMGDLGPMFGQAGHFMSRKDQPGMAPALAHFTKGAKRLMRVVDGRLGDNAYLGGDEYTIADMAVFPWCQNWEKRGFRGEDYPNFKRWFDVIQDRPAVVKSDGIAADLGKSARAARQGAGK
ncbi:MAG: glutathione S-transferase family protein [Alphaproteobacteria bacterium]|nr:MAG: glutathione S-transferase family protein [Alphaproteobacteria bacterium]